MSRREMLKLSCAGSLAAMTSTVPAEAVHAPVPLWEVFEITLTGPDSGNPFTEVQLGARFVLGRRLVVSSSLADGLTRGCGFDACNKGYEWTF